MRLYDRTCQRVFPVLLKRSNPRSSVSVQRHPVYYLVGLHYRRANPHASAIMPSAMVSQTVQGAVLSVTSNILAQILTSYKEEVRRMFSTHRKTRKY
jgi:hypothetical protein